MKINPVFRRQGNLIRLFRIVWTRGVVGDGSGYSCKLSLAITPRLFRFSREFRSFFLVLFGLRLHFERSFGGIHT